MGRIHQGESKEKLLVVSRLCQSFMLYEANTLSRQGYSSLWVSRGMTIIGWILPA